ncbi:MAG: zinc ribbon domain-containing protein [Methanomicrobiales archaeon]|nr:zinc ribbon domain-containing protein [Methanomicrobiales archaeon]
MFKEGSHECISRLQAPSRNVLDTGLPIRNEPFDKRQALWNQIKANAEKYRNGECGTFLKDLHTVFLARFDASLLLLAVTFQKNGEQFEGTGYFNNREIEAFETIEQYGYFRILSKSDIAKKIRGRDEKTLTLLREYSVSGKKHMDGILSDSSVRDTIRSHLKKQWDDNNKKISEAIGSAGVDLDFFAQLPAPADERSPQTIIINAGNDAAINLGNGTLVRDSVLTRSSVASGSGGKTSIADSVVTGSTITSEGTGAGAGEESSGISIRDSVVTGSTVQNVRNVQPEKEPDADEAGLEKKPEAKPDRTAGQEARPAQKPGCPACGSTLRPGAKFCTGCGAKIPAVCSGCGAPLSPDAKFCSGCGRKTA